MGWLQLSGIDYDYRKKFTVSGGTQIWSSYPIKIRVYYGEGEDNGSTVYINNHSQKTDFIDVAFTKNDGTTEIYWWIENYEDSKYANFWVELIDVQTTTTDFYIYYGHPIPD